MATPELTVKSYAICSIFNEANPRATLSVRTVPVQSRDVLDKAIPQEAYRVQFYDQPDAIEVQGRKAAFAPENFSAEIYIAKAMTGHDRITDRQGRTHAIRQDDVVYSESGHKIWPKPV